MPLSVRRPAARALLLPATLVVVSAQTAAAQQEWSPREILARETYVRPPAEIERLVTAPRQRNVDLSAQSQSPERRYFAALTGDGLPSVQAFGKARYYLAGLQVDPRANRSRLLTIRGSTGLQIVDAASGQTRAVTVPAGATVSSPEWSPDGSRLAFIANFDDASRVYVADAATGRARQLAAAPLLATLVTTLDWTADGKGVVAVLIPDGRKAEPKPPAIAPGPLVRMTDSAKNKTRTYWSLLKDPYEKELMEHFVTGQLAVIDAQSGAVRKVGAPAMISAVDASPDGRFFRVAVMQKPFSYITQYSSFGQSEQVWDASGRTLVELAKRPLREGDTDDDQPGPGGVRAGQDTVRRSFGWMPNGQGLYFLRQEPAPKRADGAADDDSSDAPRGAGAQGGRNGPRRKDRLVQWLPPFDSSSQKVLLESDNRIGSVLFAEDGSMAFVAENVSGTGHVYATYFAEPGKRHTIWRLRGLTANLGRRQDGFGGRRGGTGADSLTFYQNPGDIMTKPGRSGEPVALLTPDKQHAFLEGTRYQRNWQEQAPRGFVDRVEIRTGKKTPVFEGAADVFESAVGALDDEGTRFVVERESPKMVPDAYVRDARSGQLTRLTSNRDYTPEFTAAIRKRIPVSRADGTRFWVNLTLPADYREGTRLPAMFWFYPYEYTDQAGYDRTLRTENINRFPPASPRTIEYLVTQGYAVANFQPPVIGEQGRMNDNYVADLRNNLYAVIDELDRLGYIDRARLGIGGHSYGAFSTVNAMVHTPYFKAGIAGDGMYNRSLTPMGFQSERRDFWEGQQTYLEMSPFFRADDLTGALLMYHSIEDQNVGTHIISSERMMHALEGLGKTAALYMYPYEDHGPAAKETLLDQWARWTAWLDIYVKNGKTAKETKVASPTP